MTSEARIVAVGLDLQLHVIGVASGARRQLTLPRIASPLSQWGGSAGEEASSWPVWSPDGRWVACFQHRGAEGSREPFAIAVLEVDGIEERVLVELEEQQPIFASWSPGGDRLALLSQREQGLELEVLRLEEPGERVPIAKGSPFFFCWASDDELLLHVGDQPGRPGRLLRYGADGRERERLADPPGSFCTPFVVRGQAIYLADAVRGSRLRRRRLSGGAPVDLGFFEGLVAVLPAPDGRSLALATAPRGEGTPYDGVWSVPLDGAEPRRITDEPCMAFFWEPDGQHLLLACVDAPASCLRWRRVAVQGGAPVHLAAFWPSREQLFYLHFFEQFAASHPVISPDGRALIFSATGLLETRRLTGGGSPGSQPKIYALDLTDPEAEPVPVCEGVFAAAPLPAPPGADRR